MNVWHYLLYYLALLFIYDHEYCWLVILRNKCCRSGLADPTDVACVYWNKISSIQMLSAGLYASWNAVTSQRANLQNCAVAYTFWKVKHTEKESRVFSFFNVRIYWRATFFRKCWSVLSTGHLICWSSKKTLLSGVLAPSSGQYLYLVKKKNTRIKPILL